ncbi:hypothetical protein IL992_21950 [Microbispora sp. NEAU-D428]|uniref:hypothetical protein n=1 Tax=Microbispora sitophila TaxID=2771537 RepID=UPI00186690A0|nr:hypothetical protein [Microbispora sitophila]MBE3011842.1 hypothetical protein [Microbispora sitophila]
MVATDWGPWLTLSTGPMGIVDIVLDDGTVLARVTTARNGTIGGYLTIPTGQRPGEYMVQAVLRGQVVASAAFPLTVLGEGFVPPPEVFITTEDGIPLNDGARITAHHRFHVRGFRFRPGSVDLFVDEPGGISLGTATQEPYRDVWEATPLWPGTTGRHRVVAVQGHLTATSVELNVERPPA